MKNSDLYKQLGALNTFITEQNKAGLSLPDATLSVSLGGKGGAGNAGGTVDVFNTGEISTSGKVSHGILAQSIGGGGGNGGAAYAAGTSTLNLIFAFGGTGGAAAPAAA